MDCGSISDLTLSQAATCIGGVFSIIGRNIGNLTVGQVFQSVVAVAITPALLGSLGLPFHIMGNIWQRWRGGTFRVNENTDSVRKMFTTWYGISGLVGLVVGVSYENALITFAGLWLMAVAVFFILSGREAWGEQIDADGKRIR